MKKIHLLIIFLCIAALTMAAIIVVKQQVFKKQAARMETLRATIKKKNATLSRVQEEVDELNTEKSLLTKRRSEFDKKLNLLERKVRDAEENEKNLSGQVTTFSEKKKQMEDELAEKIQSMEDELKITTEKIKKEAAAKSEEFYNQEKDLITEVKELKSKLDDFNKEKNNLQGEMTNLFAGLIEEKTKLSHYNLGFTYENEENYEAAIREYEEILKIDLGEAYANLRLANIYIHSVNDPNRASYYAREYFNSKDMVEIKGEERSALERAAEKEIDTSVKLNVAKQTLEYINMQQLRFYYNSALIYDNMGRYAEAVAEYKKALEQNPDDPDTHYNLGIVYDAHIKDKEKAIHHYAKYLESCPNKSDAKKVEGWINRAKSDLEWGKKLNKR